MNETHVQMLNDIRCMIADSGVESFLDSNPFRSRADHLYRCYCWAKRILPCRPDADAELTLVSTLFHDIGVIACKEKTGKEGHDVLGGDIVKDYLLNHGYDAAFAEKVAYLVAHHQQRELLNAPDTPIEHIILMEADMLDERGALGVVWDAMAEGAQEQQSYESTLARFKKRKLYKHPDRNPMVTEIARAIWWEKVRLHMAFVDALEKDLGINE